MTSTATSITRCCPTGCIDGTCCTESIVGNSPTTWHDRAVALISLLHGPNLNLLGQREPHIYGTASIEDYVDFATTAAKEFGHEITAFQTNHEGALVDAIH